MAPKLTRLTRIADIPKIPFSDGLAAIEVPVALVDKLPIRDHERGDSMRLRALEARISAQGFRPVRPIVVRVGRKGRWVVVDGGHRLTALFRLKSSFWARVLGRLRGTLYIVLFLTPDSWSDVGGPPPGVVLPDRAPEHRLDIQVDWDRSRARGQGANTND